MKEDKNNQLSDGSPSLKKAHQDKPYINELSHRSNDDGNKFTDSKIGGFVSDIQEGDLHTFDVTTKDGFLKELILRIKTVDVSGLGAELSYFFLFSMFPLLIFLFTLLPYLNLDQAQVMLFIRDYAPEEVATMISDILEQVLANKNGGLLSIGILATLWSASKGMNALTKALNRSYFKEDSRSFVVQRGMSIVFTIMLVLVVVVALGLPVFGEQIGSVVFSYLGFEDGFNTLWNQLRFILPPILIAVVFTLIYWLVPDVKLPFKTALPGALFATIGWIITTLGFSFYVSNFGSYANTYGSIGTIIILMLWLYFSAIILMIGGQINAVMKERAERIRELKSNATA
ncbi:YihY/virulence factor BrkB family protein [Sporosarcina aquimarina]|uniref:YihY/virulence factor BrkB family protein n=1 Tax=Sporosarcina aquimarina TaxID=114975 RepID=UPI00203D9ECF|nr:YihY/virulence factor BrkB family protein [Sporosarcina aquimarina]MCM3759081.1 YihY/virulence factor BrkB family protein [Sporosarcina aquimarina]